VSWWSESKGRTNRTRKPKWWR